VSRPRIRQHPDGSDIVRVKRHIRTRRGQLIKAPRVTAQDVDVLSSPQNQQCTKSSTQAKGDETLSHILDDITVPSGNGNGNGNGWSLAAPDGGASPTPLWGRFIRAAVIPRRPGRTGPSRAIRQGVRDGPRRAENPRWRGALGRLP
jgi:hypothetical protein